MWRFSRKKPFFSPGENEKIVHSIQDAERQTSGEIRIFVEGRCKYVDALDRASEIFARLQMEKTELRNGVLFYIAIKDKQLAIFADKGIHEATGGDLYWKNAVKDILSVFSKDSVVAGITTSIFKIGEALKTHFPYDKDVDKNELPDEIVFGK
ncbi:MAG TPA: TPM domain-containing protein [Hanamia sp.]|nr:TPM domain-containing protein [Hanamia sp.]